MLYLYPKNTVDFTNNGDPIHHSYDEHVIRDDGFYLTFNLLLDKEEDYKKIKKEMIISADTPDGINQFRIYDIKNKSTSVEVTAVQLMYDFDNKEINPFSLKNATGSQVISRFKSSFKSTLGQFTMDSSVTETHDFATNDEDDDAPSHNALEVLNRITNRWDSELMLNGFDIRMIKRLGAKTDALLYEKKNINEFEDASSVSGMITRIHATSKFTPEGKEVEITLAVTVDSPLINEYAQIYEKSYVNNDCRTEADLIAWTKLKYSTENVDKPSRTITVSTNIIDGTEINYGDDLVLKYLVHDVDEIIRCVGYDYDPIKSTYYSVTLGDWKDSFATTLTGGIVDKTNQQLNQIKNNITYISMSANGKNRNAYGPEPVSNPINGDNWYYYEFDRPNDVELRIFQDGFWVAIDFATKKEVEAVLVQADLDRAKAEQDVESAKLLAKQYTDAEVLKFDTKFNVETGAIRDELTIGYNNVVTAAKAYTDNKGAVFDTQLELVKADVASTVLKANAAVLKADKSIEDVGFMKIDVVQIKSDTATAISTAETAKMNAANALTNAATAISTANTAKTNAGTALTTAQTSLANSGTALTNAQNALNAYDNLEIGGRNYLRNSNFSNGLANWIENGVSGYVENGVYIVKRINSTQRFYYNTISFSDVGKTVTVSLDVRIPEGTSGRIRIGQSSNEGLNISITAGVWQRVVRTFNPNDYSTLSIYLIDLPEYSIRNIKLEKGQKATDWSPAPEDIQVQITDINGELSRKVAQTTFDTLNGTVTNQGTQISQSQTAIGLKADKTLVDTINQTVANHTLSIKATADSLATKAEKSLVDSINQTVTKHTTDIKVTADGLALKSDKSVVDSINSTVNTHTSQIKATNDGLALKADSSLVNTVKGTVDTHTTQIKATSDGLALKAEKSLVDTINSTVGTHTTQIKATSDGLALKAEKSLVDTVKSTVDKHTTDIKVVADGLALKAESSLVNTINGTVNTHTNQISANSTAIAARLTSAQVDSLVAAKKYVNETTLNATASGLSTSITQVSTDLSNLEIGGRNLLTGTKKELTWVTTSNGWGDVLASGTNHTRLVSDGTIEKGEEYALSVLIDATNSAYPVNAFIRVSLSSGGYRDFSGNKVSAWAKGYSNFVFTLPTDATNVSVYPIRFSQIDTPSQSVGYGELQLKKGNKATDWSPAPEDMATLEKFTTLEATVNGINTTVGTKASQTQVTQLATQWTQTTSLANSHTGQIANLGTDINLRVTKADLISQINVQADNILIQTGKLYLDVGSVTMTTAYVADLNAKTLTAVTANIATIRSQILITDVITSVHLKVDNAMMDKLTATTAVVNYLFTKTAFVDNLNAKTLTAITANIATIRSQVLISNVVQATHLVADGATVTKLFASDANVQILTAKTAFINAIKAVSISADMINGGTINANLVNLVNLNASSITAGVLRGANYALDLNLGTQMFTNPNNGNTLIMDQGVIGFHNSGKSRYIEYWDEGLRFSAGAQNTGTSANTGLQLIGGHSYVEFISSLAEGGVRQRIEATGNNLYAVHGMYEAFRVRGAGGLEDTGKVIAGSFHTSHLSGEVISLSGNNIYTPNYGNRDIYITPNGTGSVIVGTWQGTRWNVKASDFVKQSSRITKTNIVPLTEGLSLINRLTPVSYNKIDKLNQGIVELEKGFISEDSFGVSTPDGLGIYDSHITAHLVKGVQELHQKLVSIDSVLIATNSIANNAMNKVLQVDSEVQQMKNKISELEKEIKTLKGAA